MTLSKFGQHFIIGLDGVTLSDGDKERLKELKPAGIFIDGDNFESSLPYKEWLSLLRELIDDAKKITENDQLIVAIDHEGGRVHRVPEPLTKFPYAYDYLNNITEVAQTISKELNSIGINLLFGPVADIYSNPDNPVIGKRALSSDPKVVGEACYEYIKICEKNNLICAPKHFPGHGDTTQDSHVDLPRVDVSLQTLLHRELVPFQFLADKVKIIMTSHVVFPQVDPLPATLSKVLLTTLLRNKLNFDGVIVSDDLDMKAIKDNFSEEDIVMLALNAGVDLFLFNHEPSRALEFAKIMEKSHVLTAMSELAKPRIDDFILKIIPSHVYELFS